MSDGRTDQGRTPPTEDGSDGRAAEVAVEPGEVPDDEDGVDDSEVVTRATVQGGIVVGHDGSGCAQEAFEWAAALARRSGWPLHVVRAWRMATAPNPPTQQPGFIPPLTDYEAAVLADLRSDVAAVLGAGPAVEVSCHAVHAAPVRALVEAGEHADLLVVGSRGHGGFTGLLLGSVSAQCVHSAPCPVTVVRTQRED